MENNKSIWFKLFFALTLTVMLGSAFVAHFIPTDDVELTKKEVEESEVFEDANSKKGEDKVRIPPFGSSPQFPGLNASVANPHFISKGNNISNVARPSIGREIPLYSLYCSRVFYA